MWNKSFKRAALVPAGLWLLLSMAGCPLTFEGTLPDDLDASIKYILSNRAAFQQDGANSVDTGVAVDDLQGLSGCWGAYSEALAGQGSLGQMNSYSLLRFGPQDMLTTWDVVDTGGLVATIYNGSGRYAIVGDNRLRFTIDRRRYLNPLTRQYDVFEDQAEVSEWLATLEGNRLYLRMLDEPGAPVPGPEEPDYTIVYQRFECVE